MWSLFFLRMLALFLNVSSFGDIGPPITRRRSIQDQVLFPILASIGTTLPNAPLEKAVAVENTLPALPPSIISNGVLWRTVSGQALPATPSSLVEIMKREVLGVSTLSSGIVCISERHDDFEHHKVQLKVLMTIRKVLAEREQDVSEKLSIGMEMFQRRHQTYLDRYIAKPGSYSIGDLQRDTNWDQTWGYDLLHYLPLLQFAQKRGIRILGLHPSDDEVEYVQRHGLAGVGLTGVCTTDHEHAEEFKKVSMQQMSLSAFGGCQEAMDAAIMRQYEVQCFREEYMAETAAIQMAYQPDGWIALLAGERHILKRKGLPFRVLRRSTNIRKGLAYPGISISRGVFTIVPKTISFPIATKDAPDMAAADYVWYVQRDPLAVFVEDKVNLAPL